jgi:hypothetical protein
MTERSLPSQTSRADAIKSVYKVCIETRNFEINQLIQRNNFFMLFQGVLLAATLQAQNSKPFVEFVVCFSGLVVSLYQTQMASGAKFWQEWWESRVDHYEKLLEQELSRPANAGEGNSGDESKFYDLFAVDQEVVEKVVANRMSDKYPFSSMLIMKRFPVGRAPIRVGIALAVTWAALLIHTLSTASFPLKPLQVQGFIYAPTPPASAAK